VARHLPVLLRPAAQPWAVRPAAGAVVVAVLVLGVGTAAGRPVEAGLTYFGVACAAVFVTGRHYRVRVALVGAQAAGAIIGMTIGAVLPTSTGWSRSPRSSPACAGRSVRTGRRALPSG
jgi:hypothetical protein